ncbi:MAG: biopolymer transporter ExbD [Burkholderiales bacterium]|nr:biopolymer transporter ExbD [Burkholderiales bacterium]MDE2627160.1 biopolymer transporter ExbD [Burkholderiales bacterium]
MKYFESRKARIEIIPMIDIMFFLLVFFVMTTLHMIPDAGIASRLPTSATAQTLPKPQLTLAVDAQGLIHLKQQTLSAAELEAQLRAQPHPDELQVTIAGDGEVALQKLIVVMDACRAAGVTHIGLAARPAGGA